MEREKQTLESKTGEIVYRKKLFEQYVEGKEVFEDRFSDEDILKLLRIRMNKTVRQVGGVSKRGFQISPFIELGAERAQRSMALMDRLGAQGFALDISWDSLRSAGHYAELLEQKKVPILVCCDAYNLPFRNNAVPFAFCYQTLHHFPDPAPILAEIYRVLAPGCFFFDEEPFKPSLHLGLIRRKSARSLSARPKGKVVRALEAIFTEEVPAEREYGIVENHDISRAMWKRALQRFDQVEAKLVSPWGGPSNLYAPPFRQGQINRLLGGSISALCQKTIGDALQLSTIWDALGCPNCRVTNAHGVEDRAPLRREGEGLFCESCNARFPTRDGILFLFEEAAMRAFYPGIEKAGGGGT